MHDIAAPPFLQLGEGVSTKSSLPINPYSWQIVDKKVFRVLTYMK